MLFRSVVRDPAGAALRAHVRLTGRLTHFLAESDADEAGRWRGRHLPFGPYLLEVTGSGFAGVSEQIEIRSEIPVVREITLSLERVETVIEVLDSSPLLDPRQTGTVFQIERDQLREEPFSTPGRGTSGLVNSLPGWLLEANSVLHPRGSEYDTQYVVDGIPLTDNRSPAVAPSTDTDELEAVHVFTANIPAEYGRKLGGVIELLPAGTTRRAITRKHCCAGGAFRAQRATPPTALFPGARRFQPGRASQKQTATWIRRRLKTSPITPRWPEAPSASTATWVRAIDYRCTWNGIGSTSWFPTRTCRSKMATARIAGMKRPRVG